jgi:hypothetical protein
MALGTSPRAWFDAVSWHVRGLFATEDNRSIGFAARELWQPAEIEARRGLARELATEVAPELRIDRRAGFLVLPPAAIPDLSEVCAAGQQILQASSLDTGVSSGNKKFSRFRLAQEEQRHALLKVALDRRMLAMAASYLGTVPVITEADYYCSFPVTPPFTKSQLWHCDDDARDVLKIFVYCADVAPEDGPFELIPPAVSRAARAAVGYRFAGRRYRVSDEAMARQVPPEKITTLLGPKGTAFVVDTVQCFHRGSRITQPDRSRIVGMICYCPASGRTLPRRLASGAAPMRSFVENFGGGLERAVLGMPLTERWI